MKHKIINLSFYYTKFKHTQIYTNTDRKTDRKTYSQTDTHTNCA